MQCITYYAMFKNKITILHNKKELIPLKQHNIHIFIYIFIFSLYTYNNQILNE